MTDYETPNPTVKEKDVNLSLLFVDGHQPVNLLTEEDLSWAFQSKSMIDQCMVEVFADRH